MSTDTVLIEARKLGRRHPGGQGWLLHEVSLQVRAGQRMAIVGSSGSGKTLLLRALALLDPLDAGEVRWRGEPITAEQVPNYRRRVIYLHQKPVLFPGTVESNFQAPFALGTHRGSQYERSWIVDRLRDFDRDAGFLEKSATELSGGEGQLAALLRAVQLEPTVLLLDEPTASLDPEAERSVEQFVASWWGAEREKRSLVWVTHQAEQAGRIADHVVRLDRGTWQE